MEGSGGTTLGDGDGDGRRHADACVLADALHFVGWLMRCNYLWLVIWVAIKKKGTIHSYVSSVGCRNILFSDTHSGVCSQEHLPFREMNILVRVVWYKVCESH